MIKAWTMWASVPRLSGPPKTAFREAVVGTPRAQAQQRGGDLAVGVVNNSHRLGHSAGQDVEWHGDGAVRVRDHIGTADIFAELPGQCGRHRRSRDGGPAAECVGHESVGAGLRQQGAERPLVGVVIDRALRPVQGLTFRSRIKVAASRNVVGTARIEELWQHHQHQESNQHCAQHPPNPVAQ